MFRAKCVAIRYAGLGLFRLLLPGPTSLFWLMGVVRIIFDGEESDGLRCRSLQKPPGSVWPWGTLSPRPPGIYRFELAPVGVGRAGRSGLPGLLGSQGSKSALGSLPSVAYPPLEQRECFP